MNTKERDRLKVLHELKQGHFTQGAAAQQLGVTDRWVRKLLVRVKQEGDGGIVHRLRGRESNRRLEESVRVKALKLVAETPSQTDISGYDINLAPPPAEP